MAEKIELSAVHVKAVKALRPGVLKAAQVFGHAREKVKEIAPKVIGLLRQLQAAYPGMSLIDFVRQLDPTVPASPRDTDAGKGYQSHPTYYTVRYMQQALTQRPRGAQRTGSDAALDILARSLATIVQIDDKIAAEVWQAVAEQFKLEDRGLARLKKRVAATKPILDLTGIVKPHHGPAKVIKMTPEAPQHRTNIAATVAGMQGTLQGLRTPGQRVRAAG